MAGETSLAALLRGMQPVLNDGEYVYCTLPPDSAAPAGLNPLGSFREQEGQTLILERADAERAGLGFDYVAAWLTLEVHSALQAVGLTAAVAGALTKAGISCNVVAAWYHDHLFVAHADGPRALEVLRALARDPAGA
ncbi:ACT domain-containing protein [Pseudomonas sp. ZM23]|uniref:ACT domain-containing protein n=1 Tax=Pseudomonas triclosanedens TaxID=2961893 RepID=A0ABY6ZUS3_9PSED|nr:ACT domain-containing protein [Pseudomonas triclosanedens]MCP8467713.1 ACT domain-containing protein [Pseudomonas triclosanedens]MCP8473662.1 ACT domain-containing protein [Pseudomonas triclosanedens]MCP8479581.1 ACT domain-containing protein [Pseudomonas triclosanedens]WAI48702.1 ACT domain-containing protein [Pseudomonas triclosanedens]